MCERNIKGQRSIQKDERNSSSYTSRDRNCPASISHTGKTRNSLSRMNGALSHGALSRIFQNVLP